MRGIFGGNNWGPAAKTEEVSYLEGRLTSVGGTVIESLPNATFSLQTVTESKYSTYQAR